jgi:hypothetical protein
MHLAVPCRSIASMCAWQLPPQACRHVPSWTTMKYSDMDPNAIPDIAPMITHHGVLTVAEENYQLEALAPHKEMQMQ